MAIVRCPECQKKLKVADASVGKKVRCSCGHVFVAQTDHAGPVPSPAAATAPDKVVVACTECAAKLKVAGASLGKRMKCPKCAAVFVAAAPPVKKAPPSDELEEFEEPVPKSKGKPAKNEDADDLLAFGQEEANEKTAKAANEELYADDEDVPPKGKAKPGKKPAPKPFDDDDEAPRPKGKAKKTDPDEDDDEAPVYPSRLLVNILVAFMVLGFVGVFVALFFGDAVGDLVGLKGGLHADVLGIPKPRIPGLKLKKKDGPDKQDVEKIRAEHKKKELAKLEGAWVIDTVEVIHAPGAPKVRPFAPGQEFVFAGDKLSTTDHKDATFTLDASENPKWLDFTTAKGSFSAIYKFEGETLEWYMGFPQTVKKDDQTTLTPGERPIQFDLTDKGGIVIKLRKKKDDAKGPGEGRIHDKAAGFSIVLPKGWEIIKSKGTAFMTATGPTEAGLPSNLLVRIIKHEGEPIENIAKEVKASTQQVQGRKFLDEALLTIDGKKAWAICNHNTIQTTGKVVETIGLQYFIIGNNNKVYLLSFATAPAAFAALRPALEQSALTARTD